MRVLVGYATRHGATAGIAERIGDRLRAAGLEADVAPVGTVRYPAPYDAFVIGAAAYMFHWLKEATAFVERHRELLASHPVWLFSSGPLGADPVNEQGEDQLAVTVPKEFPRLRSLVHPRGEQVFFGALDLSAPPVGLAERFVRLMPAARDGLPQGDFRDWPAIDAWADGIARELLAPVAADPARGPEPASAAPR
jgi:menaquinone-dependent protoporphyrinogen oxidase